MPSHANTLNVPQDLRTYRQFVTWRLVNRPDKPKPTKFPNGSTTDPSTWKSYDEAVAELNADSTLAGIGFVFTEDDPFVFVDIDNCLQDDGSWHADALAMIQSTPGMTWETSQSGRGLHGIGLADKTKLKRKRNRWKSPAGIGFEFYYTANYVAFGHLNWTKPEPGDVTKYILKYVPDREDAVDTSDDLIDGPRPHYSGPKSDEELIKRARSATGSAAAAFGNAATFEDLWTGNAARLAQFYPANNGGDGFDHSAADAALIDHLAFWTGYDEVRMIRLFSQSALGQRDKWTKRPDYRVRTLKAITSNADGRYIGTDARTPSENSLNRQTGGNEEIAAVSITKRASDLKDRLLNVSCIGPVLQNNYLIKGWLDQGCLSVFYGPSNCGKTFVAVDIGMHVGASATWRG
ncbi:hypothetical protein NHF45_06940 [Maricaulaceae bacterium NA33B04]|nr:hypothetical protein [Maricaulaceae bacterium NA33B04]